MKKDKDMKGDEPLAAAENRNLGPEEGAEPEAAAPPDDPAAERDEFKDRLLRMAAEMENYKKRNEREKAEFRKFANEALLKDLLGVMDNLDRAMEAAGESGRDDSLKEGLGLTRQEMTKVLTNHGLERIEALGQPFNPELHEAMMQQENPDVEPNTVILEMQKGYLYNGRLLRPAMVVVSKKSEPESDKGTKINVQVN